MADQTPNKLKSDVIGLVGAATLGVVMLSPAMTLYGGFGPTFLAAGHAAPLALIWSLMATIPTALSYVLLSRDYPLSGSAAAWAALSFSRKVGVWAGWMVFFYYFTNFIIQPVTLGVFAGDVFKWAALSPSLMTYLLGVVVCSGFAGWMAYRGTALSVKGALGFLLFEMVVVIILCATVIKFAPESGARFSLDGFSLSSSPMGASGIFRAMVFGMMAYCGFDVVSTLAEETKMAKKLIPQATILSLLIYAVFIIIGEWCLTYGGDPEHLKQVAESGQMPISDIASRFWGNGSILVSLTAISASLGLAIATAVGASRILFSMGRDRLVSPRFSALHPRYSVPWNSLHFIFIVGTLAAIVTGVAIGQYNSYVWWGTTSTYFAMVTYLLVNLSCLVLHRDKIRASVGGAMLYGLLPFLGLVIDGYILYRTFFVELWAQDWLTGKSVIVFDLGCSALALVFALRHRNSLPVSDVPATQTHN